MEAPTPTLILAPSRSAQRRAGLHCTVLLAVLAACFTILGFAAGTYTAPAPTIRCAMFGEG